MATIALKRNVGRGEATSDDRPAPVPKARYHIEIESAEEADDKYGGWVLALKILSGDFKDRVLDKIRIFPGGRTGPNEALKSLVEAVGGDSESDSFDFDLADLESMRLYAYVDQRTSKKGQTFNNVTRFAPAPQQTP